MTFVSERKRGRKEERERGREGGRKEGRKEGKFISAPKRARVAFRDNRCERKQIRESLSRGNG